MGWVVALGDLAVSIETPVCRARFSVGFPLLIVISPGRPLGPKAGSASVERGCCLRRGETTAAAILTTVTLATHLQARGIVA